MYVIKWFVAALFLSLATLMGCGSLDTDPVSNPSSEQTLGLGTVSINLVASAQSDFSAIAKTAEVKVSGQGMNNLGQALTVTSSGITGTVTGITAGLARKFEVLVYDASSKVCYYGSAAGDVVAGTTTNIAMTLYKTTGEGNATINGTIQSSNTPPVVSLTSPTNNAQFTVGNTIALAATASDADGTVSSVAFYNGSTLLNTDTAAPYAFSFAAQSAGTYTLTAVATDNSGATTTSAAVTVTVSAASLPSYRINAGGSAVSPFTADQYYSGGQTSSTTSAITVSGVTAAAPMAVYQAERYGNVTYAFPNLPVGQSYTVRLHFAEIYWTAAGKRKFNVSVNGSSVLSNFDIYAAAGAAKKAVVRETTATVNSSGQIQVVLTSVTDNAAVNGIEVIPAATAPVITTQPASQAIAIGKPVTFSVTATGGNLTYQWYRSGYSSYAITGATSASYTIASVSSSDVGDNPDYNCVVTNSVGSVTSNKARLDILGQPTIVTQPISQVVAIGQPVTFFVGATGGNLTYQWYKYGYGTSSIVGATSASFTIPSVSASDSGDNPYYYCVVSNSVSTVTSSSARLDILSQPTIVTQPVSQAVAIGQPVTFSVTAAGGNLTYQWYKYGYGTSSIVGATSASYTIPSVSASDSGDNPYYYCVVSNSVGTVTSSSARLDILGQPTIVTQPVSQAVAIGQPVTFSVTAAGGNLTYQWYKYGYGTSSIVGATSASYTIPSVSASDSGDNPYYYCVVSNSIGTVTSSSARLDILSQPTIVTQPVSKTVAIGQSVTFSVTAAGGNLTYQWYKYGYGTSSIVGATSASYTIPSVIASDSGDNPYYYCVVSNSLGTVTSSSARLDILSVPTIVTQPVSQTVVVGQSVTFSVTAAGGNLTYQWYKYGYGTSSIVGATSASYTIPSVVMSDSGDNPYYYCVVTNSVGTVTSSSARLTVSPQ